MNYFFESAISEAHQKPPLNPAKDIIFIKSSSPSPSNKGSKKSDSKQPEFPLSSKKILKRPFIRKAMTKPKIKVEKRQLRQSTVKIQKSSEKLFLENIKQRLSEIKDIKHVKHVAEKLQKEFLAHFEEFDKITIEKQRYNMKKLLYYLEEMNKAPRSPELVTLFTELIERKKKFSEKKFWNTFNKLPFEADEKKPILAKKRKTKQNIKTIEIGPSPNFLMSFKKEQKQEFTEKKTEDFLSVFIEDLSFTEKQLQKLKKYYQKIEGLSAQPKNQVLNINFNENNENSGYFPISKNITSAGNNENNNNELIEIIEENISSEESNNINENRTYEESNNDFDDDCKDEENDENIENDQNSINDKNDESCENDEDENDEDENDEDIDERLLENGNKEIQDEEYKKSEKGCVWGEKSISEPVQPQTERKTIEERKDTEMPSANFILQGLRRNSERNNILSSQKTKLQKPLTKKELSSSIQVRENLLFK